MTSRCTAAEPSPRLRHPSPFCKAKRARGQESMEARGQWRQEGKGAGVDEGGAKRVKGGRLKHSGDDAFQVVCFGTAQTTRVIRRRAAIFDDLNFATNPSRNTL